MSAKLYVGIAALGMLTALAFGAIRYVNGVDAKAFERGRKQAEAAYAQRDNEALRSAHAEIDRLNLRIRAQEDQLTAKGAEIDQRRQKEIDDARAQRERDIVAVRAGFRLRDPGCAGSATGIPGSAGSSGRAPATAPGVGDDAARCRLSGEATEFLLGEADRADEVVRQLGAAQELIREYRRILND